MNLAGKKPYVLVFACLVLAGLLILLAFKMGDSRRWEAMTDRVGQLKIAARVRKVNRSVFGGEPIAGNAWEEYNIALEDAVLLAKEDQNGSIYYLFANGDTGVDRAKVRQLVAGHAKAIEHLRLGAKRSDGQYSYNWEMGPTMDSPSLLASRKLGNIALAQARIASPGEPSRGIGKAAAGARRRNSACYRKNANDRRSLWNPHPYQAGRGYPPDLERWQGWHESERRWRLDGKTGYRPGNPRQRIEMNPSHLANGAAGSLCPSARIRMSSIKGLFASV
jgi:hypothetical protein